MAKKVEDTIVHDATDLDVKLGRGKACQLWSGNQRYRTIIRKHQQQMKRDKRPGLDKDITVESVLQDLGEKTRFLKPLQSPGETGFVVISREQKLEKIRQALRDRPEDKANKRKSRGHASVEEERRWVEVAQRIGGDKPTAFSDVVLGVYDKDEPNNQNSRTLPQNGIGRTFVEQHLGNPPLSRSPMSVVNLPSSLDWSIAHTALDLLARTSTSSAANSGVTFFPLPAPTQFPALDNILVLNSLNNARTPIQELRSLTRTIPEVTRTENARPVEAPISPRSHSSPSETTWASYSYPTSGATHEKETSAQSKTAFQSRPRLCSPPSPVPSSESTVSRLEGLANEDRAIQIPKHIQALFNQLKG